MHVHNLKQGIVRNFTVIKAQCSLKKYILFNSVLYLLAETEAANADDCCADR